MIDKNILGKKSDLYFVIIDPNENSELYSSKEFFNDFTEVIQSLPISFNFSFYINDKHNKKTLEIYIKEKSPVRNQEDTIIAKANIYLDVSQRHSMISDKYAFEILKKNYFTISNKKSRTNPEKIDIIFFLKFLIGEQDADHIENSLDKTIKESEGEYYQKEREENNNEYNENENLDKDLDHQEIYKEHENTNNSELINYNYDNYFDEDC